MISWILQIDKFGTLVFTKDTVCWAMSVSEGNRDFKIQRRRLKSEFGFF